MPEVFASVASFERDLRALAAVMQMGSLYLIGGEPLLHPELPEFLRVAREVGIAERVGITTNGVLLHAMSEAAWDRVQVMHVTRYPGVRLRMSDDELARRCLARGVALRIEVANEFRVTLINHVIADRARVQEIYDACRVAHVHKCRTVYDGRYYKCAPAPFARERLRLLGREVEVRGWEDDGVALHDNPNLRQQLAAYLDSAAPLAACAACLGTSGCLTEHRQMNRAATAAWLAEDHSDYERLIDARHLVRHRERKTTLPDRTHVRTYSTDTLA
jgi:organic radical activating enzyme